MKLLSAEFLENQLVKITYIDDNDRKQIKYITIDQYCACILSSNESTESKYNNTDILPYDIGVSTIKYGENSCGGKMIYLVKEKSNIDINYFNKIIYKNVGIPRLLFKISILNNVIQNVKVYALKAGLITEKTKLYKYPFSNVFNNASVCFGTNDIKKFDIKNISNLYHLPELFLHMPNNCDMYSISQSNKASLQYNELLELLQGEEFPDEWLCMYQKDIEVTINQI